MTKYSDHEIEFKPLFGLYSPHLQMVAATLKKAIEDFPSKVVLIPLEEKSMLATVESTPPEWKEGDPIACLLHGLGGSDRSNYMIRIARNLYRKGIKCVRINFRGCGKGFGLSKLPYNGGLTDDILAVIKHYKSIYPESGITITGFSLGGNLVLKLTGELGSKAKEFFNKTIAICPVLDLHHTMLKVAERKNWLYHRYYLYNLLLQSQQWAPPQKIESLYEFDNVVTAPKWGYKNADDYYIKCSSIKYLKNIEIPCQILFAKDDPFIDYTLLDNMTLPAHIKVDYTKAGSHMGYIGTSIAYKGPYWMDAYVENQIMSP